MNTKELLEFHKEICTKAHLLVEVKNKDYSGESGDTPFLNLQACEMLGICSTETGILVRCLDKLVRVSNLLKAGHANVKDESIQDTLRDAINYPILLAAYLEQKKTKPSCLVDPEDFPAEVKNIINEFQKRENNKLQRT
jgi:hypothetical protein